MCAIEGTEGSCRVEAFVFSEKTRDEFSYSCAKLNKSTYIGRCVRGNLEGMAVIVADGTQKSSKEAFLSYFLKGRMAYPAISSYVNGDLNFGVQELNSSYGCVYFGNWDKTQDRCRRFIDI